MTDQIPESARDRVEGVIREAVELDESGDSPRAIETLTPLLREFPEAGLVHSYLAWVLSRAEKHREAIEHGRLAVRFSPDSERISLVFFRILWSSQEYQQAFDEMQRFSQFGHSQEYVQMMQEWKGTA